MSNAIDNKPKTIEQWINYFEQKARKENVVSKADRLRIHKTLRDRELI